MPSSKVKDLLKDGGVYKNDQNYKLDSTVCVLILKIILDLARCEFSLQPEYDTSLVPSSAAGSCRLISTTPFPSCPLEITPAAAAAELEDDDDAAPTAAAAPPFNESTKSSLSVTLPHPSCPMSLILMP
jgi:hypothetical protein